jgi:heat shock protein HslJ
VPVPPGARGEIDPSTATFFGIYDSPVTLTDGSYEGEPFVEGGAARPRLVLTEWLQVPGDLDGDGVEETVVFLEESSGGSGRFVYLAVLSNTSEGAVNTATALVGDRVQIRGASVRGDRVSVRVVQSEPGDAACCPSRLATRHWRYANGNLAEEDAEIDGSLSLEVLEGPEWVFLGFGDPEPLALEQPITLLIEGARVGGFSGCNRYMGSAVPGQGPGAIEFGPLAGTMMACPEPPMEIERRYLSALQACDSFGFRAGRLVMRGTDNGTVVVLLFESRPSATPPR